MFVIVAETNRYYSWGMVDAASHFTALQLAASTKSIACVHGIWMEYKNIEGEVTYSVYMIICGFFEGVQKT
jgi:hypothetical protein